MKFKWYKLLFVAGSLVLPALFLAWSLAAAQGGGSLTRVTTASGVNRFSWNADLSGDGMRLAFESSSDLLGQGVTQFEIWLYDTQTMIYTRITTVTTTDRESFNPSLNGDGTKVAFQSDADLLGQGIPNHQDEIWLYDTRALTYTRVTTAPYSGVVSRRPSFNQAGTRVAFQSDADFLGQGNIWLSQYEIWLCDLETMQYTRVTTANESLRYSENPDLNAAGTRIVFQSDADLLGQGIPQIQQEIWLYDLTTHAYTRVTTASAANRDSYNPSISADGTKIVFESDSDLLGQGIPDEQYEIWLYDTTTMTYTRITTASTATRDSHNPRLSADGKWVAFHSDSQFMGQGGFTNQEEIWLYNLESGQYTRITNSPYRNSQKPSISANGTKIAFQSDVDFLGQGNIAQYQDEIWLYDWTEYVYLPLVVK